MQLVRAQQPTGFNTSSAAENAPSLSFQCPSWVFPRSHSVGFLPKVSSLIHSKRSFACWGTGWIWKLVPASCFLQSAMPRPGSKAVEAGHRSDSLPYSKPAARLTLVPVFLPGFNLHLENAASGLGRVVWCLHSTIHPLGLILIVASHKGKKPLKSGLGRM